MKLFMPLAAAALLLWNARAASAQHATLLARGDVTATAGRLAVNVANLDSYDDWHGQGLFTAGAGWYWTDHLKTDVEIGGTTKARTYAATPVVIGGQPHVASSQITFSSKRLALLQRYQFGRNEWFHPNVGAGLEVVSRSKSVRQDPVWVYDQVTRQSRLLIPAVQQERQKDAEARALAVAGFKAYVTRRAFFLGDFRVAFTDRPEDALLRFGVGVDF